MLRGAVGLAGGAFLAGCGTTARNLEANVPVAPQTPLPVTTSTVTPLPRYVPSSAPTATLTMRGGTFVPRTLAVAPGTVIRVVNADGEMHSLMPAQWEEHHMRSSDIGPGNSVHMTAPDTPGEYKYTCLYHSWIAAESGTIVVATDQAAAEALNQRNGVNSNEDPGPYTPPPATSTPGSTSTATPSATPTSTFGSGFSSASGSSFGSSG